MTERQTNKRLLRDLIDVFWNQGALDRHAEFFVPGAVVHSGLIDYAVPDGLVGGYAQGLMAAFPDLHHTIDHQLIDGDRAAMRYHGTGTLQNDYRGLTASGQKIDYHGNVIFRLSRGRIAEVWSNSSLADWVAAQKG